MRKITNMQTTDKLYRKALCSSRKSVMKKIIMNRHFSVRSKEKFKALQAAKIRLLIMEALDIAFYLCNSHMSSFGIIKVFDILNQILPTAYVLNTSYWVFYSRGYSEQSLCVCKRYGEACRHKLNGYHWVDLDEIHDSGGNMFEPNREKFLTCNACDITVETVGSHSDALDIKIGLHVRNYEDSTVPMPRIPRINQFDGKIYTYCARYWFRHELYPNPQPQLVLHIHPCLRTFYGQYFAELKRNKTWFHFNFTISATPYVLEVKAEDQPRSSLFLIEK